MGRQGCVPAWHGLLPSEAGHMSGLPSYSPFFFGCHGKIPVHDAKREAMLARGGNIQHASLEPPLRSSVEDTAYTMCCHLAHFCLNHLQGHCRPESQSVPRLPGEGRGPEESDTDCGVFSPNPTLPALTGAGAPSSIEMAKCVLKRKKRID